MQLFAFLLTALAIVSLTTALPVAVAPDVSRRSEDIVYSPPIKSPSQGTIWKVGSKQVVTWDATSIPQGAQGNKGIIMLGYDDDTGSENLDFGEYTIHRGWGWGDVCHRFRAYMSLRRTPPC
jgi:hypothetical protein